MTKVAIITVSDSRTLESDQSGALIAQAFRGKDAEVLSREVVKDDRVDIQAAYLKAEQAGPDLIITNGGTGIARRDVTISALRPLFLRVIPGFGEELRQLSYEEIGPRALASGALAAVNYRHQFTYCLPGSTNACQTALDALIIPDYQHLLFELSENRKEVHHHVN